MTPSILLDTNILLRLANAGDPQHGTARAAVGKLAAAGERLCYVPQCAYEYFVVATRPVAVNGLGVDPWRAAAEISAWVNRFHLLPDDVDIYRSWLALIGAHPVRGRPAHDARLVAAMIRHGVPRILTFNGRDFARYPAATVIDPATV